MNDMPTVYDVMAEEVTRIAYSIGSSPVPTHIIPWKFWLLTDTSAVIQDSTGLVHQLVYGTDYSCTGSPAADPKNYYYEGGTITLLVPASWTNCVMTIWREQPFIRDYDISETGPLDIRLLNNQLDRQLTLLQDLKERVSRAYVRNEWEIVANSQPLVHPSPYEGWVLGWNNGELKNLPPTGISGSGPQGIPGATGPQGPPGPQGDDGAAGNLGPMGPPGDDGVAGPIGPPGNQGQVGLKGDKGDTGATGAASTVPGPTGPQGIQGPIGLTGPTGPAGPTGAAGGTFADAVSDGSTYGRMNATWNKVLPLTGGTLTGALALAPAAGAAALTLNTATVTGRNIFGQSAGSTRWLVQLGNGNAESGSNAGSDFVIQRYTDGGVSIDQPLTINRASGQTTLTGALAGTSGSFSSTVLTNASYYIDAAAGSQRALIGRTSGSLRWIVCIGNNVAEGGSNAGSDFFIQRFTDAGAAIDVPLAIDRSSGMIAITAGNSSGIKLNNVASQNRSILATTSNLARWRMDFANNSPEGGSNAGSDFGLYRFNDAGTQIDQPLTINRADGHATLTIQAGAGAPAQPRLDAPAGTHRGWAVTTAGTVRWFFDMANGNAEGGSNSGSDLEFRRHNDAGTFIDSPLSIVRSSGMVSVATTNAGGFNLTSAAGQNRSIQSTTGSLLRWRMDMANNSAEGGSNTGSDWGLNRFNDSGVFISPAVITAVRSSGIVSFGAAIVNGPSDRSLKENITPLADSLDKILSLQGVSFNMKASPDKPEIGLIAQDVEPIVPEVIQEFSSGEGEGQKLLALDYPKLVAVLIEAVKELNAKVTALEARLG